MFNKVLGAFTEALKQCGDTLVNFFKNIIGIFYNDESGLTFYGVLLLIFIGMSLLIFGINFVLGLIGIGEED